MALTIRLNKEEEKQLDEIQEFMMVGTYSGAIKAMIHCFMELHHEYKETQDRLHACATEVATLSCLITDFVKANKEREKLLSEMKKV